MSGNLVFQILEVGDTGAEGVAKINANLALAAAHTHSSEDGTGQIVPLSQVSIISDINAYSSNEGFLSVDSLLSLSFSPTNLLPTHRASLFVQNEELWFVTNNLFAVQVTLNGALNVKVIGGGGFTGPLVSSGASVGYNSTTDVYTFLGNSGGATTLKILDANVTLATISTTSSVKTFNFKNISFTNFSTVGTNGIYLLFEGITYNPQFSLTSISGFAQTSSNAQTYLRQTSFTQGVVENTYGTNIFCKIFGIVGGMTPSLVPYYVTTPTSFEYNRYVFSDFSSPSQAFLKGNNLFFSIYDRDGTNLPVTYSTFSNSLQYYFSPTYPTNFTPLIMRNQFGFEV